MARRLTEFDLVGVLGKLPKKDQGRFLSQFSETSLANALRDGRQNIDLGYIVRELVQLYHLAKEDPDQRSQCLEYLDRFKDFILLGAAQNPKVLEAMRQDLKTAVGQIDDPFVTGRLKLKKA